jgi:hypothetical protein
MMNAVYAISLFLVLVTGFPSSSFTFAENYLDISNNVDLIHVDQLTSEEERELTKQKAEERIQQAKDKIEQERELTKQKAEERIQQAKDKIEERKDDVKSNVLEKRSDLREKFQNKKDEIKTNLKERHAEIKDRIQERHAEIKDRIQNKKDNIQEFRDNVKDRVKDDIKGKVALEIREKIKNVIKDQIRGDIYQEKRENIKDEIHDIVEYRTDLIKSKIKEIGKDKFREIVLEHKQQIHEETKERIDTVRDKVRSSVLIDQVEDGSYYGNIVKLPGEDITNYILSFQGDAYSTTNENITKSVSGNINLELIRTGDSGAILKIIGGQIVIENTATGELYNVYDVAFGRSRANFDNDTLQVAINTVDVDGQPHTFIMQTSMNGIFPTELGEVVDIFATDGKSKSGTEWILDFVGILAVDDPVPIMIFQDVEELSKIDNIIEKSIDDCYDLTLFDFYTDADLEGLSNGELAELEEDLLAEVCSELGDDIEQDILGNSQ